MDSVSKDKPVSKTAYRHRRIGGRHAKQRLAHHLIWEEEHGPIPEGYQIHHLDHDRGNNHLLNLIAVSVSDHQRLHSPYYCIVDGEWRTVCRRCKEAKRRGHFSPNQTTCKPCRAILGRIQREHIA